MIGSYDGLQSFGISFTKACLKLLGKSPMDEEILKSCESLVFCMFRRFCNIILLIFGVNGTVVYHLLYDFLLYLQW